MKILYLFPHPDDESFGPGGIINQQIRQGHEVSLVTFTKGGATKMRHKLGLSIKEMGEVRHKEMKNVQHTLGIHHMTILDYEDGALSKINPLKLQEEAGKWIHYYNAEIVITYPIHGGSGHHDHIALHMAVKQLFYASRSDFSHWQRLAFFTLPDTGDPMFMEKGIPRVTWTKKDDIDVICQLEEEDIEAMKKALLCYETYQEMIETTNVIERIGNKTHFELADEYHPQVLSSLTQGIDIKV
ncbi:MAG: PIG-L family deacetylase [Balneolaceae bacterium]|nr:PIG-L family deacetylase [Balneolaceae bacterium]